MSRKRLTTLIVGLLVVGLLALGLTVFARVDTGKRDRDRSSGNPAVAYIHEAFVEILADKLGISVSEVEDLFAKDPGASPTPDRTPPQKAIDACSGASEGDTCEITTPRGALTGSCTLIGEQLACTPQGGPPAGGPRGKQGIRNGTNDLNGRLQDLADRLGLSVEELRGLIGEAREEAIDRAVAAGYLTEEQAQRMKERMEQRRRHPDSEADAEASMPEPLTASIQAYPNPVVSVNTAHFVAQGQGVAEIKADIYDLSGRLVYDSGFVAGNELAWHLDNGYGGTVANGVYLYVVTVKGYAGEVVRSAVQKLVVLR